MGEAIGAEGVYTWGWCMESDGFGVGQRLGARTDGFRCHDGGTRCRFNGEWSAERSEAEVTQGTRVFS